MSSESQGVSSAGVVEQELSDFSYIVSHDLTASLRHVSEFSKLVMGELAPEANDALAAYGAQLQNATERCGRLMDQLLVFSRVQQRPLELERCYFTRLMEIATLQLSAEVSAANAVIDIGQLGEGIVDSELVIAAFRHVLSNALKFRKPGVTPHIRVRGVESGDSCTVTITDNGIGVTLDRQERMFRIFYQDHQEGAYAGVGAGLAICRRILRRHGGEARFIACKSGACLEIMLPKIADFRVSAPGGALS